MSDSESKELEYDAQIDTRGLYCPEPLFEVRNLSDTLEIGQCFKVLADDPAAEEDLKRWAKRTETKLVEFQKDGDDLIFYFQKVK
ncbi:MAG: sulfurtransferase TusA family protein [Promethearchaeota archaeon]